jgi:hypothetical protein
MFCVACGTLNPDKAYFCSRCGHKIRPATVPPVVPPQDSQNSSAPPPSSMGSSWIDPQATKPKSGDSWIQTDTPPVTPPAQSPKPGSSWVQMETPGLTQTPAPQIPLGPPSPPNIAPTPTTGTSWIDPAAQASRPADSWVKFSQPAASVQGPVPPPPAQTYGQPAQPQAQPGYPSEAYNPAYAQGFPQQGYAMPGPAVFLQGVGGWLMFFIVCLTIIGPLIALFTVVILLMGAGANVNSDSTLASLFAVFALLIIPYTVWGMFIGIALWKIRPGAVRQAKQYLIWGSIPFAFLFNLLPFMVLPPWHRGAQLAPSAFTSIAISVALALAWNSYLTKSRRVAITYPQG